MTQKFISLFLTLLLLGQNFAFAAADDNPNTLAEYQKRAIEETRAHTWLKTEGVAIISIFTTAGALGIIYIKALAALQKENLSLKNQIRVRETVIKQLEGELQKGLPKKTANHINNLYHGQKVLRDQLAASNAKIKDLKMKESIYIDMLDLPLTANLERYIRLFEKDIYNTERQILLRELEKEPWVQALGEEERKKFLRDITEVSAQAAQATEKTVVSNSTLAQMLASKAKIRQGTASATLLKEMVVKFMSKKNLLTFSVILLAGWASTANAQSKKRTARLNQNFKLFLEATPEQLAEIEKDPTQSQACIQGAETLHLLSFLDQEQVSDLLREARHQNRRPIGQSPAVNAH